MTLSDKRLRQHKKAAAGLAIGTSTLGVAALGSKGAAVGARRALKAKSTGLRKIPRGKLERVSVGADRAATNLTVTGAGLGGIGGYNFAAIQAAEAKRRPRVVSKRQRNNRERVAMLGTGGAALAGATVLGRRGVKHLKAADKFKTNADNIDRTIDAATTRAAHPKYLERDAILRAQRTARRSRMMASIERTDGAVDIGGASLLGAAGGALTLNSQRNPKSRVSKNYGGAMGMDFGLSNVHQHLPVEISKAGATTSPTGSLKPIGPVKPTPVNAQVRPRPATTPVVPTKPAVKGGTLSAYRSNPSVSKAYDPERKRSRRLEGYQTGLNVGAGALGAGAVASGRGNAKAIRRMSRQHLIVGQEAAGALRKTGRTGALGLGAVGAAFAADRVGRYRKGRGRSYNALRG